MLDLVELIPRLTPGRLRKRAQSSSALPRNSTGLGSTITINYTKFCMD
jgi:hypothetical protein